MILNSERILPGIGSAISGVGRTAAARSDKAALHGVRKRRKADSRRCVVGFSAGHAGWTDRTHAGQHGSRTRPCAHTLSWPVVSDRIRDSESSHAGSGVVWPATWAGLL